MDSASAKILSVEDELLALEERLVSQGFKTICGVDEAGRGPLAGPVVAAAVIYRDCELLKRCCDSKSLTVVQREELFPQILDAFVCGIGSCTAEEIDELNIRRASLTAMVRAVKKLGVKIDVSLVDGRDRLPTRDCSLPIIKGDAKVATIGAASILAKVTRDRFMIEADARYPGYGFAAHKGYPTAMHRHAIRERGICPLHRRSFRGVREYL